MANGLFGSSSSQHTIHRMLVPNAEMLDFHMPPLSAELPCGITVTVKGVGDQGVGCQVRRKVLR